MDRDLKHSCNNAVNMILKDRPCLSVARKEKCTTFCTRLVWELFVPSLLEAILLSDKLWAFFDE
jgi:hypothetical protein